MAGFKRANRVSKELRAALAEVLVNGLKDPRVTPITLTSIRVTDDLRIARVNFVPLGGVGDVDRILTGLEAARGFLRREIGRRVHLKYVPELRFHLDQGLSESFRVTEILDQMREEESAPEETEA
jgi:ribosome-binding factor A